MFSSGPGYWLARKLNARDYQHQFNRPISLDMEHPTSSGRSDATHIARCDRPPVIQAQRPRCGGNCALSVAHNLNNQRSSDSNQSYPPRLPLQKTNSDRNRQVDLAADKASIGPSASILPSRHRDEMAGENGSVVSDDISSYTAALYANELKEYPFNLDALRKWMIAL
ncbi:hypothetical protein L873DRAFT_1790000 [Choiromyces venosus 120613-1]|uniref:Uncharacterized protein n=1 Tax=Choiromyces venosus 120613-1 TaxID=1336337 RepID=A0A3N4JRT9_9PEZI|nr:hypothetical protein L873DRAFT_1790000 [Choiromyces venosus 120613-1]